MEKINARKWTIKCPIDGDETPVDKGDVSRLMKNHGVVAVARATCANPLLKIQVRNMAGDMFPLVVQPDDTVAAAKRRLQNELEDVDEDGGVDNEHFKYRVDLQVWFVMKGDESALSGDPKPTVMQNDRTIGCYGIKSGDTV